MQAEKNGIQKFFKQVFTNDGFFAFTTWSSILFTIPFVIVVFLSYDNKVILMSSLVRLTTIVCLTIAYFAYKKHSKNVMKGMIGSALMGYMVIIYSSYFAYDDDKLITIVAALLMLIFCINHYRINSEHHSNPIGIYINQIMGMFFAIVLCIEAAMLVPDCVNLADTIVQISMCLVQPCAIFCMICIEARIDAYKINRENAGWTKEAGYPEGYIREYEKK